MEKLYLKKLLATTIGLSIVTPAAINILEKINTSTVNTESNNQQIIDIVQKELPYIDARNIPVSDSKWIDHTHEQIKAILDNHGLEFNQEQWVLDIVWKALGIIPIPTMSITYLSFPEFSRQIAVEVSEDALETEFNNSVKETLNNYQFQDLTNYEQEIKNIIESIKEKLDPEGYNSIHTSDWKITKKDGYIEVHYQPLSLVWLYEPIKVSYN